MLDSKEKWRTDAGLEDESLNREISRILLWERIRGLAFVFSLALFICLLCMLECVSPQAAQFLEKSNAWLDNYYLIKAPLLVIIWGGLACLFLYLVAKLKTRMLVSLCAFELLLYLLAIIYY